MKNHFTILCFFYALTIWGQSHFIPNQGQWNEPYEYKWENQSSTVYFHQDKLLFHVKDASAYHRFHEHHVKENESVLIRQHAFEITYVDANPMIGKSIGPSSTYHNYFLGNDTSRWKSKVPLFSELFFEEVYSGVDIHYYSVDQSLKYNIHLKKGTKPDVIKMNYNGADSLFLESGFLIIRTSVGEVIEQKPLVWQIIDGEKRIVDSEFTLEGNTLGFKLGRYNKKYPIIIDPQYIFSTYSNSTADNFGFTACYDSSGNMYGAGVVYGTGYPTTLGALVDTFSGGLVDIGISKFSQDGSQLLFATYIGGNMPEQPHSMVVGNNNSLYVMGITGSENFPVTPTAYDTTFNGGKQTNIGGRNFQDGTDIILFQLDSTGSTLVGSTFFGGSLNDGVNDSLRSNFGDQSRGEIIVDSGKVYVASCTHSQDFPLHDSMTTPADLNATIIVMNASLELLDDCEVLGGNKADAAYSLRIVQRGGNKWVFIAGGTKSSDLFTGTKPRYQSIYGGGWSDGFILAYNLISKTVDYETFNGTPNYDQNYFIEVDRDQRIYVYGQSKGLMPVTPSNVWRVDSSAQFIQCFDLFLSKMIKGTVFGDGSIAEIDISPTALMVDDCNNIYLSGWGGSTNTGGANSEGSTFGLPTTPNARDTTTDGNDFYFLVLDGSWLRLEYASFFGEASAEHVDGGTSRFSKDGTIYQGICAGCSNKTFPTFPNNVYSHVNPSQNCNLGCTKVHFDFNEALIDITLNPDSGCAPHTLTWDDQSQSIDFMIWDFGDGTIDTGYYPVKVYQDTGHYRIKVIGIDTMCVTSDTSFMDLYVYESNVQSGFTVSSYDTCTAPFQVSFSNTSVAADSYIWDFGDGNNSNLANPVHTYQNEGKYDVSLVSIDSKCGTSDTSKTTVLFKNQGDNADFNLTFDPCDGSLKIEAFQIGVGFNEFEWDLGDGTILEGEQIEHIYGAPGSYDITLLSKDTICNNSQTTIKNVYVSQDIDEDKFLPNIFSPNEDGMNDNFKLIEEGLAFRFTQFSLLVYNRWGGLVYETNNPHFKWDGKFEGEVLSDGVYFWLVSTFDSCNDAQDFNGVVHIYK